MEVYLNGEYVAMEQAKVSVDDRGFLFADGVYEVARVYDGRIFAVDAHLRRLAHGLGELRIALSEPLAIAGIAERLLDANDLRGDALVYVQVTRGEAPRSHPFPAADTRPTVYVMARAYRPHPEDYYADGVAAVTVPDTRWTRCDIKSIALLPNVLANQAAKEADAFEALFVRDGIVLEGSHSNLFAVIEGRLVTYPASNYILPGITREVVLDLARTQAIPAGEGLLPAERLFDVDELFLSGTTTEVLPIVRVDGRPIADGQPGPITRRLLAAYRRRVRE